MSKTFRLKSLPKRIKLQPIEKKLSLRVKGDPISKGKSEAQIQAEICSYLDTCNICYWVFNIQGKLIKTKYGYRRLEDENRGFADLLVCFKGYFIHLEIKRCGGLASEDQLKTQIRVRNAGGVYEFVTSVREVQAVFSKIST